MYRLTRWALPALAATSLALTGCGGGSHATSAPVQHYAELQIPKQGKTTEVCSGLTDTCVVRPTIDTRASSDFSGSFGGYSGCKVPDVSSYQGTVDWNTARGYICGAVFKGGEYVQDPYAARNNSELARLHIWRAMYWFVRNTGCDHEAAQIIGLARAFGVRVVANDIEVPEAAGYNACLVPRERAAGLLPVTYAGPGTWPGGGYGIDPLWQAEYGPVLHRFWEPIVAWQCTDGVYGCATYVPGIGQDDVSVDLGLTKLGVTPPDPWRILDKHVWDLPYGQRASEYNTARSFEQAKCHNPVRRVVCKSSRFHLQLLRDRLVFVIHYRRTAHGWVSVKPDYRFDRGARLHRLQFDITQA